MATSRDRFNSSIGGEGGAIPTASIPEFPKLPDCLKKHLTAPEKKEVEAYEFAVQEFFKKQAIRG